jgi:hypothetical protein
MSPEFAEKISYPQRILLCVTHNESHSNTVSYKISLFSKRDQIFLIKVCEH